MSIDVLLNSPFATVILGVICLGLLAYGKYELLPKIAKLEATEQELKDLRKEKDEVFDKALTSFSDIAEKLDSLNSSDNEFSLDFQNKLVLLVDRIERMDAIISKHPNNLEVSVVELANSLKQIGEDLDDLIKGYETISSTLLQSSGRGGNDLFVGMERLR